MPDENIKITKRQRDVLLSNLPSGFTMETINLIRQYWGNSDLIIEEDPLQKARKIRNRVLDRISLEMTHYYEKAISQRDEKIKELEDFKTNKINDQINSKV